jgi:hypothetical protein
VFKYRGLKGKLKEAGERIAQYIAAFNSGNERFSGKGAGLEHFAFEIIA